MRIPLILLALLAVFCLLGVDKCEREKANFAAAGGAALEGARDAAIEEGRREFSEYSSDGDKDIDWQAALSAVVINALLTGATAYATRKRWSNKALEGSR